MRELIESGIDRILKDHCTPELLLSCAQGQWPAELWTLLEDSGFTRALCSSEHGGSEASWFDIYPLLVSSGYHSLPLPLADTLVGNYLLDAAGLTPIDGPVGLADESNPLTLRRRAGAWQLDGQLTDIPWGRHCQGIVAQVDFEGQPHVVRLDVGMLTASAGLNLAREPRDSFTVQDLTVQAAPCPLSLPHAIRWLGAYIRAAQSAGACQSALDKTIQYAGERIQFGRPLAKFQAIQHQIASAVSETAAVGAAVEHISHTPHIAEATWDIATAKIMAAEAASKVASVAHAVHGGMGFTAEHPLHFATQRLWSWRSEFGNLRWWSEVMGRAVCQAGADHVWAALVEPNQHLRWPA